MKTNMFAGHFRQKPIYRSSATERNRPVEAAVYRRLSALIGVHRCPNTEGPNIA
jgi:hypothetical protein